MTTDGQLRNRFRLTGVLTTLFVWASLSGVGDLSAPAGLLLGVLAGVMLAAILIWLVCEGDTGSPSEALPGTGGIPGWVLFILVLCLLLWIGLSGVGDMSAPAGFVFALLAMIGLIATVVWSRQGGAEGVDTRFAMLDGAPAHRHDDGPLAALAEPDPVDAEAEAPPDELQRIKGIGPALEAQLRDRGVRHFSQIATWDEAEIDAMAEALGRQGARIRNDDWVGQARALLRQPPG